MNLHGVIISCLRSVGSESTIWPYGLCAFCRRRSDALQSRHDFPLFLKASRYFSNKYVLKDWTASPSRPASFSPNNHPSLHRPPTKHQAPNMSHFDPDLDFHLNKYFKGAKRRIIKPPVPDNLSTYNKCFGHITDEDMMPLVDYNPKYFESSEYNEWIKVGLTVFFFFLGLQFVASLTSSVRPSNRSTIWLPIQASSALEKPNREFSFRLKTLFITSTAKAINATFYYRLKSNPRKKKKTVSPTLIHSLYSEDSKYFGL